MRSDKTKYVMKITDLSDKVFVAVYDARSMKQLTFSPQDRTVCVGLDKKPTYRFVFETEAHARHVYNEFNESMQSAAL